MRSQINTSHAPAAIGPYSQGIRVGNLVFTAGQLGLIPKTGEFAGGDAVSQTRQAMDNVKTILEAAGASLEGVIKTTIYLIDLGAFAAVNAVYGEYFGSEPPARSTVQVAALPRGGLVEIEAIAVIEE